MTRIFLIIFIFVFVFFSDICHADFMPFAVSPVPSYIQIQQAELDLDLTNSIARITQTHLEEVESTEEIDRKISQTEQALVSTRTKLAKLSKPVKNAATGFLLSGATAAFSGTVHALSSQPSLVNLISETTSVTAGTAFGAFALYSMYAKHNEDRETITTAEKEIAEAEKYLTALKILKRLRSNDPFLQKTIQLKLLFGRNQQSHDAALDLLTKEFLGSYKISLSDARSDESIEATLSRIALSMVLYGDKNAEYLVVEQIDKTDVILKFYLSAFSSETFSIIIPATRIERLFSELKFKSRIFAITTTEKNGAPYMQSPVCITDLTRSDDGRTYTIRTSASFFGIIDTEPLCTGTVCLAEPVAARTTLKDPPSPEKKVPATVTTEPRTESIPVIAASIAPQKVIASSGKSKSSNTGLKYNEQEVTFNGRNIPIPFYEKPYAIVWYSISSDEKEHIFGIGKNGEVIVMRLRDGKMVRLWVLKDPEPKISSKDITISENRVLSIKGIARELDLRPRAFDMEATVHSDPYDLKDNADMSFLDGISSTFPTIRDPNAERSIVSAMRNGKSAIILGESGSGKTEAAATFMANASDGLYEDMPSTWCYYRMEESDISADTGKRGDYETRIHTIKAIAAAFPMVIFVDDFHTLRGSGTSSESSVDALQHLNATLSEGHLRFIGTDTVDDFNSAFATSSSLLRRIQRVELSQPSQEEVIKLMRQLINSKYSSFSRISNSILQNIIETAEYHDNTGSILSRSVRLLEKCISDAEDRRSSKITRANIEAASISLYNIPESMRAKTNQERNAVLTKLRTTLDEDLVGTEHVKAKLVAQTATILTDIQGRNRTRLNILLTGTNGVGKSSIAEAYGKGLGLPVVRIPLNTYHRGVLLLADIAGHLQKNPYTVFILDELDKSSMEIQESLLELMDNGKFRSALHQGNDLTAKKYDVNATKATIIFTSNYATETVEKYKKDKDQLAVESRLRTTILAEGMSRALLQRIDAVLPIYSPTREEFKQVARLHFKKIVANIQKSKRDLVLNIPDEEAEKLTEELAKRYHAKDVGNRELISFLHGRVKEYIAQELLAGTGSDITDEKGCRTLTIRLSNLFHSSTHLTSVK